jgi:VWFA-related protein
MRRGLLAAMGLALLILDSSAQSPQFRSGTALVVVDVVATRVDGKVARDLTAADFEVIEDGRPQAITTFQFVNLEDALAQVQPAGAFANTGEPGAIFALVLDEMKIDVQHTAAVRKWARRVIEDHVRPHDFATVLRSGHTSGLLFTSDHAFLTSIVEQATPRRARSAMSGLVSAAEATATGLSDTIGLDNARETEDSLVMLRQVVERLAAIPARRKAVFWFSQGVTVDMDQVGGAGSNSYRTVDALRDLLAAARRGNVAIYGIDPRGLSLDAEASVMGTMSSDHGGMRDIADATGGRTLVNTNDLAGGFERMVQENRAYYLLGYAPTEPGADRRARRIEVRTRAPGVSLLHRRHYVPDPTGTVASVEGALGAVLPGGELAITLTPSLVIDPKGGMVVSVPFEVSATSLDRVSFTLAALALDGKPARAVAGKVAAVGNVARDRARLRLEPGLYQLRLAAEVASAERRGVAFATIVVPKAAAREPQCGGFLLMQGTAPPRPNVTRKFDSTQAISGVVVVSAEPSYAAQRLELAVTSGTELIRRLPVSTPREFKKGYWNVEFGLQKLPVGRFELALTASGKPAANCSTTVIVE